MEDKDVVLRVAIGNQIVENVVVDKIQVAECACIQIVFTIQNDGVPDEDKYSISKADKLMATTTALYNRPPQYKRIVDVIKKNAKARVVIGNRALSYNEEDNFMVHDITTGERIIKTEYELTATKILCGEKL